MNPALRRYQGSFRRSMRSFVPGLTFHAQVGANILYCMYILIKNYLYHCHVILIGGQGECWCHFRAVLAGSSLWTISTSNCLLGALPERLSPCTAAASHEAGAAEVYGEEVEDSYNFFGYLKKCPLRNYEHCSYYSQSLGESLQEIMKRIVRFVVEMFLTLCRSIEKA